MTEEERKSYEILYEKIIFVDKYRFLKPHWIKFHNYTEKLQKEIEEKTTIILVGAEKVKSLQKENEELKNKVVKRNNELIELEETSEKEFITKQEVKENFIPKDKIKGKIKEYNKEIKTYEDKMLEITQREKHSAIENKDYIKYSCIISNFTDKIKLLEELLEEE